MRRGRLPQAVRASRLAAWGLLALLGLTVALLTAACAKSEGAQPEGMPQPQPAMSIELPDRGEVTLPFTVSGWAVDLAALEGPGIEVVEIVDQGCRGPVIGIAEYGLERPDIAAQYGEQFRYSGWQFQVTRLRLGDHVLAVRTKSDWVDDYNQCQAFPLTVRAD